MNSRHYLHVRVPAHRKAITRLLVSDHNLSIERVRYALRYREAIPREWRLCGFCRDAVEDETHALMICQAPSRDLGEVREEFLTELFQSVPALASSYTSKSSKEFLVEMVHQKKHAGLIAKFVFTTYRFKDPYNDIPFPYFYQRPPCARR